MEVKFKKLNESAKMPTLATQGSAGYDLYATETEVVPAGGRKLFKTGFAIAMPRGYKALITPRSGLALKKGITVLNAPGLIDSDYRGEIGVILYNTDSVPHIVEAGDRIAQMQFEKVITVDFVSVDNLDETNRSGGFGSTGT